MKRSILARVLVRQEHYNPHWQYVKDEQRLTQWKILAEHLPWYKGYGIKIEMWKP